MDTNANLASLPAEVFLNIALSLSHQDLVSLLCSSQGIRNIVEPLLWTHIELFPPDHHETFIIKGIEHSSLERNYRVIETKRHLHSAERLDLYQCLATAWFMKHASLRSDNPSRIENLYAYTQSLSAPLFAESQVMRASAEGHVWHEFPHFVNLRTLELAVIRPSPDDSYSALQSAQPLARLSSVKLYGYVPKDFALYVLRSCATLESLDIGLLDDPIPGEEFERTRELSPLLHDVQQENNDVEDLQEYDDNVAPRSLIWIPDPIPALPRLKHLHLCRPTEMDPAEFCWGRVHYSISAEEKSLEDWGRLLEATKLTLQSIVIDQRPATHENALEGGTSDEFIKFYSQPSSRRLMRMLLPLLEQSNFPCLKRIDCAGLLVNDPLSHIDSQLRRRLVTTCQSKDIKCEFSLSRRCIFTSDDGLVYSTDGMGADDF